MLAIDHARTRDATAEASSNSDACDPESNCDDAARVNGNLSQSRKRFLLGALRTHGALHSRPVTSCDNPLEAYIGLNALMPRVSLPPSYGQLQATLASKYDVERELGRAGMAIVYLARPSA